MLFKEFIYVSLVRMGSQKCKESPRFAGSFAVLTYDPVLKMYGLVSRFHTHPVMML